MIFSSSFVRRVEAIESTYLRRPRYYSRSSIASRCCWIRSDRPTMRMQTTMRPAVNSLVALLMTMAMPPWKAAPMGQALDPHEQRPGFEVASVKPTSFTPGLMGVQFLPGGRMRVAQSPLPLLIAAAYGISEQQLLWPKTTPMVEGFFNIEARASATAVPPGSPDRVARQQLRLMLQALLAERFKLRLHRESKEVAAFELRVGKNGPRLAKAVERDCT